MACWPEGGKTVMCVVGLHRFRVRQHNMPSSRGSHTFILSTKPKQMNCKLMVPPSDPSPPPSFSLLHPATADDQTATISSPHFSAPHPVHKLASCSSHCCTRHPLHSATTSSARLNAACAASALLPASAPPVLHTGTAAPRLTSICPSSVSCAAQSSGAPRVSPRPA